MASTGPANLLLDPARGSQAPQHFHPPTPRDLRARAIHRLQIGVLGLSSMLLLVGLANIIMDRARAGDVAGRAAAATAAATGVPEAVAAPAATDPLADMGVVPDLPADAPLATAAPPPSAAASTGALPR